VRERSLGNGGLARTTSLHRASNGHNDVVQTLVLCMGVSRVAAWDNLGTAPSSERLSVAGQRPQPRSNDAQA